MKRITYLIVLCAVLLSCTDQESPSAQGQKSKEEKNISTRDESITKANSYSDLFLDTAALSNFITQNKVPDSIAKRIKSFYNSRNYQFAWFSSDGLT